MTDVLLIVRFEQTLNGFTPVLKTRNDCHFVMLAETVTMSHYMSLVTMLITIQMTDVSLIV